MLRKEFPETEIPVHDYITPNDLEQEDLIRMYHQKTNTWYGLVQIRNSHPRLTLLNAHIIYTDIDAGTPQQHDCVKYKFLNRKQAEKLFYKPQKYKYTLRDFNKFNISRKAKLMSRRTKDKLHLTPNYSKFHKRPLEDRFMIDQKIILGDLPSMSDKFLLIKTKGGLIYVGNCQVLGDSDPKEITNNNKQKKN